VEVRVRGARTALALIALALAGTVWALRETSEGGFGTAQTDLPPPRAAEGSLVFRADVWFLPDEALLGFVEVPAGPFLMGSSPDRDPLAFDNEIWVETGGQAAVEVPTFYVGRYEVTVAQFRAFVEESRHRADPSALAAPADHPVANVSWTDAVSYSRWLDARLRDSALTPPELRRFLEDGARVTLPTEAEWEKAARGASGRVYPWGDEPRRDRANFTSARAWPVGSAPCPECSYGLLDMSGNVWEWTLTPFQAGPYDPGAAPPDLREDALWFMRGGSFADPERNVRAAIRGGADPGAQRPFIGFRLAISLP
jgi:formylglycine-generating enzyme required for sulfatase activity